MSITYTAIYVLLRHYLVDVIDFYINVIDQKKKNNLTCTHL